MLHLPLYYSYRLPLWTLDWELSIGLDTLTRWQSGHLRVALRLIDESEIRVDTSICDNTFYYSPKLYLLTWIGVLVGLCILITTPQKCTNLSTSWLKRSGVRLTSADFQLVVIWSCNYLRLISDSTWPPGEKRLPGWDQTIERWAPGHADTAITWSCHLPARHVHSGSVVFCFGAWYICLFLIKGIN